MEKHKVTTYTDQEVSADDKGFVSYHSFHDAELKAYLEFINDSLAEDPTVKSLLPIKNDAELTKVVENGIIICKLINVAEAGTIDERTINKKQPLNVYQKNENLCLAINAAISIGCTIVNITPKSFLDGRLHLIMGMIWQVLRVNLFKNINLKHAPEIICLALPGETLDTILKLSSEKILVRWLNYHLKAAGQSLKVTYIDEQLKDMAVFLHVMGQLDKTFDKSSVNGSDIKKRASDVLTGAHKLGVKSSINADAMLQGNPKIYVLFCSLLFNAHNGLYIEEEKKKEVEKAALLDEANTGTKEMRTFVHWINSLNLEGVCITDFYEDIKDGIIIFKVIESIWPGATNKLRYEKNPEGNKFKIMTNSDVILTLAKEKGIKTIGMTTSMLLESKATLILGLIWQLMRANYLQVIGGKTEEDLVAWSNKLVNKPPAIKSFKDKELKDSRFLIDLMSAIQPGIVDWDLVKEGKANDEIELNAKYAISIARKMGAKIFLTWEDIKMVKF